jgi:ribosome-associated protein
MTSAIKIPEFEFDFSFVRSSGPGGQNVNKVNSKAVLRWKASTCSVLSESQKLLLLQKIKLNEAGELLVTSDRYRDQLRNREDCIQKLHELIQAALHVPKRRKKTKPSYSSVQKGKESKRRHAEKKRSRSRYE